MKKILGCIRKAVNDFNMISDGDKIAVGVSGGKDSLTLLNALKLYKYFGGVKYDLEAITISLGIEPFDTSKVQEFCDSLGIKYTVIKSKIGRIVFDVKKEKNPCSLCANLRRGELNTAAVKLGCNKVALAHHREDVIETFFLSLFYESRINTFSPVTYLDRKDITVIRPMIYVPESEIVSVSKKLNLPIIKNPCPADGKTKRQDMKELYKTLSSKIPGIQQKVLNALKNIDQYNLWK